MEQVEKVCRLCQLAKPITEFHRHKLGKFGVHSWCKPCKNAHTQKWAAHNLEKCRAKLRRWRCLNRERVRQQERAYYALNPKLHVAKTLKWQKRNPQSKSLCDGRYRVAHRTWLYAYFAKRRAAKLSATPPWLSQAHQAEIKAFFDRAREATLRTGCLHDVDHIFPLKHRLFSGLHVPWNLQILTATENRRKGNRTFPLGREV